MNKTRLEAGGPSVFDIQFWLSQPEARELSAEISLPDQAFQRIIESNWPDGFPTAEAGSAAPITADSLLEALDGSEGAALEEYGTPEQGARQYDETAQARAWSNYLRIRESAWRLQCSIEQAAWQFHEAIIESARLKLEATERSVCASENETGLRAARAEYAEATKRAIQWRIEIIQTARQTSKEAVQRARSEYDELVIAAK